MSRYPETVSGSILVGESSVPEVEEARAEQDLDTVERAALRHEGAAPLRSSGIRLRWRNAASYDAIRIERGGRVLAELDGKDTEFLDLEVGPGTRRYRIFALNGEKTSFPVEVPVRPNGVPGTFLRGDANDDGTLDISDAIRTFDYLFRGGLEPPCLDAVDANDDGAIDLTDPVTLLWYLFRDRAPLPPPGPRFPWLDPTDDGIDCAQSAVSVLPRRDKS